MKKNWPTCCEVCIDTCTTSVNLSKGFKRTTVLVFLFRSAKVRRSAKEKNQSLHHFGMITFIIRFRHTPHSHKPAAVEGVEVATGNRIIFESDACHAKLRLCHLIWGSIQQSILAVRLTSIPQTWVWVRTQPSSSDQGDVSHKTSCHPSPQKQIGTPAQLREPTRTPLLYSRPVTRSPRKTPEGAKREEGGENEDIFFVGKPGHGRPAVPLS